MKLVQSLITTKIIFSILILFAVTSLLIARAEAAGKKPVKIKSPTVHSVGPSCAKAGKTITITGINFTLISSASIAKKPATLVSRSAKKIKLRVPSKTKSGFTSIAFKLKSGKSIAVPFRVECGRTVQIKEIVTAKVFQVVTTSGGSVAATSTDGSLLSMEIPAGALTADTQIALTPLSSISGLPFSGGTFFGVKFEPEGLVFNKPVSFRVTLPKLPAGPIVGVQFSGPENEWGLVPVKVDGTSLIFSISHFSGGGAAVISKADFVAAVQPILDSAKNLSIEQVQELAGILDNFTERFPDLCQSGEGKKFCDSVFKKASETVTKKIATICPADLSGPLPSALETTADELIGVLASAQLLILDTGNGFACAEEIYSRVLNDAIERLRSLPIAERFARVHDLKIKFEPLGFTELEERARLALIEGMVSLLTLAESLCPADVKIAMDFALTAEEVFGRDIVVSADLERRLAQLYPRCGSAVLVSPSLVSITPGTKVKFVGTAINLAATPVLWSISPNDGSNTIDQEGNFTAGSKGGTFTISAQSFAAPSLEGNATVRVEDVLAISVSPVTDVVLQAGDTAQFFANLDTIGPITKGVTWTATGGIINQDGLFKAGTALGDSFEVRATSNGRPAKFDTTKVKIQERPIPPFVVSSSCTATVNRGGALIGIRGGASVQGGKAPYTVSGVSGSGPSFVRIESGSSFFLGSASPREGTYSIQGTISDANGLSGSKAMSVTINSSGAISGTSGCDSQSTEVDLGGSIG